MRHMQNHTIVLMHLENGEVTNGCDGAVVSILICYMLDLSFRSVSCGTVAGIAC